MRRPGVKESEKRETARSFLSSKGKLDNTIIRHDVDSALCLVGSGNPLERFNAMNAKLSGSTSSNQSVLNLINCLLGAGVLGFPYCFKSCGLVLASCIMLVSLLACRWG